ncbi:hypothetical protein RJ640_029550 [Escallonia rubra]|uniref:Uncharacterized protein n=1 Tax=Escallonia rubra TaxID=112253 RepID=A0AA88UUZ8_9ASTE|nr:hypothetical protein RJ640_029550 [Escallonia rubra]
MSPHRHRKPINPTFLLQPEHRFTSRRLASTSRIGTRARSNMSGDLAVLDLESTLPPTFGSAGSCDLSGPESLDGRGGVQRGRDSGTLSSIAGVAVAGFGYNFGETEGHGCTEISPDFAEQVKAEVVHMVGA